LIFFFEFIQQSSIFNFQKDPPLYRLVFFSRIFVFKWQTIFDETEEHLKFDIGEVQIMPQFLSMKPLIKSFRTVLIKRKRQAQNRSCLSVKFRNAPYKVHLLFDGSRYRASYQGFILPE